MDETDGWTTLATAPSDFLRSQFLSAVATVNAWRVHIGDTVVVAGSPRSGTTWLSELLASANGYNLLPEPLSLESVEVRQRGFRERTYLPPDTHAPAKEEWCARALKGGVRYPRSVSESVLGKGRDLLLNRRYVVKFVRANRLLYWLAHRFSPRGTVLILRHPCAVVASWLKRLGVEGRSWRDLDWGMDAVAGPAQTATMPSSLYGRFQSTLEFIETAEDAIAASWCIDTIMALQAAREHDYQVVFYEDLVGEGPEVVTSLYRQLGLEGVEEAIARLSVPAVMASDTLTDDAECQLTKWRRQLDEDQQHLVLDVVEGFDLGGLYDSGFMPRTSTPTELV